MSAVTSVGAEELWNALMGRKREKWIEGKAEHRSDENAFSGDAAREAADEIADLSNYIDVLHDQRRISREELDAWSAIIFDAWIWIHRVIQQG